MLERMFPLAAVDLQAYLLFFFYLLRSVSLVLVVAPNSGERFWRASPPEPHQKKLLEDAVAWSGKPLRRRFVVRSGNGWQVSRHLPGLQESVWAFYVPVDGCNEVKAHFMKSLDLRTLDHAAIAG